MNEHFEDIKQWDARLNGIYASSPGAEFHLIEKAASVHDCILTPEDFEEKMAVHCTFAREGEVWRSSPPVRINQFQRLTEEFIEPT